MLIFNIAANLAFSVTFDPLIGLACVNSETHNLQAIFFFIFSTEAMHVLRRKRRFRAFPEWFCPRILWLESVDYFGTREHLGGRRKRM